MSEMTRGQVDNENNSQSQYLNISNNIKSKGLIYKPENIAIRNGKYWSMVGTQEGNEYSKDNTGMWFQNMGQEQEQE